MEKSNLFDLKWHSQMMAIIVRDDISQNGQNETKLLIIISLVQFKKLQVSQLRIGSILALYNSGRLSKIVKIWDLDKLLMKILLKLTIIRLN